MKSVKQLLKEANTVKKRISAERDKLRGIISELEDIAESVDECVVALESGVDYLSRYL